MAASPPSLSYNDILATLYHHGYRNLIPLRNEVQGGEAWVVNCLGADQRNYVAKVKPLTGDEMIELETLRRLQSRVSHPFIVKLHDFFMMPSFLCLIFEAVEPVGEDLVEVISRCYPEKISVERSRKWIMQLLLALEFSHAHGVWHRDIKAENIIIDVNDNARLLDFGMALDTVAVKGNQSVLQRYRGPVGALSGRFVGTLDYAAPEVKKYREFTAKGDLWGLGVVLHQIYFKGGPKVDPSCTRIVLPSSLKCLTDKHARPEQLPVPVLVLEVMFGLLHPDPDRRWGFDSVYASRWLQGIPEPTKQVSYLMDSTGAFVASHLNEAFSAGPLSKRHVVQKQQEEKSLWRTVHGLGQAEDFIWQPLHPRMLGGFMKAPTCAQLVADLLSAQVASVVRGNLAVEVSDLLPADSEARRSGTRVYVTANRGCGSLLVHPAFAPRVSSGGEHLAMDPSESVDFDELLSNLAVYVPPLAVGPHFPQDQHLWGVEVCHLPPSRSYVQELDRRDRREETEEVDKVEEHQLAMLAQGINFLKKARMVIVRRREGHQKVWVLPNSEDRFQWVSLPAYAPSLRSQTPLESLLNRLRSIRACYLDINNIAVEISDIAPQESTDAAGGERVFLTANGGIGKLRKLSTPQLERGGRRLMSCLERLQ